MVLLNRFVQSGEDFAVAHFDHGIRKESAQDAEFVRQKCAELGVECFIDKGNLGAGASEEKARKARYAFLAELATTEGLSVAHSKTLGLRTCNFGQPSRDRHLSSEAQIVTAHHKDDLLETIIINLIRGTGWRGLSPMSSGVERPLVDIWKTEVVAEALEQGLDWVEDETNYSSQYLRNRVREMLYRADGATKRNILELYEKQKKLRTEIDEILAKGLSCDRLSMAQARELSCGQRTKTIEEPGLMNRDELCRRERVLDRQQPSRVDSPEKAGYKAISPPRCLDRKWFAELDEKVAKEILNYILVGKLTGAQLERVMKFVQTAQPAKQMIFKEIKILVTKNTVIFSSLVLNVE